MGEHIQWVTHKGKRILFVNCARLGEAEILASFEEMKQELLKERTGPMVLIDISDIDMTTALIGKAKELTAATKDAGIKDGPNAIVGLTGLQKAVAQLFGRGVHFADSVGEAKEWLVKEDNKPLALGRMDRRRSPVRPVPPVGHNGSQRVTVSDFFRKENTRDGQVCAVDNAQRNEDTLRETPSACARRNTCSCPRK